MLNEQKFCSDRAYFLIDREGVVRRRLVETTTRQRRENSELLEQIARLSG